MDNGHKDESEKKKKKKKKKSPGIIVGEIVLNAAVAGLTIAAIASNNGHHPHHNESLADRRKREEREREEQQAKEERAHQQLLERQARERIQRLEDEARLNRQREERLRRVREEEARLDEEKIRLAAEAQAHQRVLEAYPHVLDSTLNMLSVLTESQRCAPSHVNGKTLPYLALEHGNVDAFVMLINVKKYKVNLELAPYHNPLALLIMRSDAVDILEKIRPTVVACAKTLFALISSKFDQMTSSWPSIDSIFIWMMHHQLLPQEGFEFLVTKATVSIMRNHFNVYQALFEKHDFARCSKEVRIGYLTQFVAQRGQLQARQLNHLYFKHDKPFDVGLLYGDLSSVPRHTLETALVLISELHRIRQCPLMTFSSSFLRQRLLNNVDEAEKILAVMFHRDTKISKCYLSIENIEQIIIIASDVLTNKHQCAKFLMPLVGVAIKENRCKPFLIELAQQTQDSSFSNRLLSALPSFENLSDLRRALLPRRFIIDSNYLLTLRRWYVKNNVFYAKEMHQDFQAIDKGEMSLPMIQYCVQNKAYSMDIDDDLFPLIDGRHDIVCDLARLDNKVSLRRYVHCIPANNIEYKIALFYQFPNAFEADDYYRAFVNYIDNEQFYTQYQYIESLLKNPQALLEVLGPVPTHQPLPSAPPAEPVMTVATAVFETDHSAAPIYAVAMPYPESLDMEYDAAQQKENHALKLSDDKQQDNQSDLIVEKSHAFEPELQEKPLIAQKILLAFAKVSLDKITSPRAIMRLTRQLKNEWLAHHFLQNAIDLMFQWAKVSLLFLEINQTNGHVNQEILQFMEEDAQPSVKGLAGAWKSTMSAIGLSNNKYTLFYKAICSTTKEQADAFKMHELVAEQNNVAVQLDKALQP